jgi:KipI family sensor histidine kinase inhibitor
MNECLAALRLRPVGDAALTAELGDRLDPAANAAVRALDRALLENPFPGFVESVPTHRALLVCFDPTRASFASAADAVRERASRAVVRDDPGQLHEIAVCYGGAHGPDLEEVAALAGLRPDEVVRLHSGQEYTAFMLGFLPGFAYLGLLPERLETPRLATPRTRVPAGSVAVAGRLTGIYPAATPGGWRILGRAAARLFDPSREPPSRICAGDRVRFVPVEALDGSALALSSGSPPSASTSGGFGRARTEPGPHGAPSSAAVAEVLLPGLLTTVQGRPRIGERRFGVAGAGALDPLALAAANRALGNPEDAPGLECTLLGPTLRFLRPVRFALAGADLEARLERSDLGAWRVPPASPVLARASNLLTFGAARTGCRAYLAFEGGLDVPLVLGSPSTDLMGGFGGLGGRALAAGDLLATGSQSTSSPPSGADREEGGCGAPRDPAEATVRVVPGPQEDHFAAKALETLFGTAFTVSASSDRIACRLEGATLAHSGPAEIVSDGMVPGAIQVPPDGRPIVMLADGPTTGGYPKIGTVVTSDLALLAQLVPGAGRLRFTLAGRGGT